MKTPLLRSFAVLIASLSAVALLNGCGSSSDSKTTATTTTTTTTATDWSTLGAKTKGDSAGPSAVSHSEYLADSHSALTCTSCHAAAKPGATTTQPLNAAREAICVTCHPFSKYTMTYVNHDTYKTGTQCNKCHYSNTGVTGYSGWRLPNTTGTTAPTKRTRVDHSKWHGQVGGASGTAVVCLDCHRTADVTSFPTSTHGAGSGRTTGCQSCHWYSSGKWAGGHSAVTTGCKTCHSKANHYAGYECESCHKASITNGYTSWKGPTHIAATTGCTSCHSKHYSGYNCEWCHTTAASGGYKKWSYS
ncbi:MAG: hypothetical protein HZA04_10570, partial [Nitrospinae bacterium]|nr:hypothetical protein [Nitrospinota bacterium]